MIKNLFSLFSEKEIIKNSAIVFSASFSVSIVQFLINFFFSKQFGPESFGVFKTTLYLFSFLPVLIEFGAGVTLTRYIARFSSKDKGKINYLVKWFLKLRIFSYIVLLILILLLKEQIAIYLLKDISLSYLVIPGILITGLAFFSIFNQIAIGYQNFKLFSVVQILGMVLIAIFAIFLSYFGVYYALIGWCFGSFSLLVYWKFLSKKEIFKNNKKFNVKKIFWNYSLPMYFLGIPTSLSAAIVPLLSLFFSQLLIGYYSFAFMFYFAALLIPAALYSVLFPKVSELDGMKKHDKAKNILMKTFGIYTLVIIVGIIGCLLFSERFISLIAPAYLPSLLMFRVLVSLGLFFGYIKIYSAYLSGLGKVKKIALLVLLQNVLLFVISFVLFGFIK